MMACAEASMCGSDSGYLRYTSPRIGEREAEGWDLRCRPSRRSDKCSLLIPRKVLSAP